MALSDDVRILDAQDAAHGRPGWSDREILITSHVETTLRQMTHLFPHQWLIVSVLCSALVQYVELNACSSADRDAIAAVLRRLAEQIEG